MGKRGLVSLMLALIVLASVGIGGSRSVEAKGGKNALYVFDLKAFIDQKKSVSSKIAYDYLKLATALQGLANRDQPQIYYHYESNSVASAAGMDVDKFWKDELSKEGHYLSQYETVEVNDFYDLLTRLSDVAEGIVLWDENVPATANVASTITGVDHLLPVRYDTSPGSVYEELVVRRNLLPVEVNLVNKFTGAGLIPDTQLPSTGSAKNDAYLWAKIHYLDQGMTNPRLMVNALDGASWNVKKSDLGARMYSAYVPKKMKAGEKAYVSITVENIGTQTWTKGTLDRLGPENGNQFLWSDFSDGYSQDLLSQRVFLGDSERIAPGDRKTFRFSIVAPLQPGKYAFNANMVRDGVAWMSGNRLVREIEVAASDAAPLPVEDLLPYDPGTVVTGDLSARFYSAYLPKQINAGEKASVSITEPFAMYFFSWSTSVPGSVKLGCLDPLSTIQTAELLLQTENRAHESRYPQSLACGLPVSPELSSCG